MVNIEKLNGSIEKFGIALDRISSLDEIYESIRNNNDAEKQILEQNSLLLGDQKKMPEKMDEYFRSVDEQLKSTDQEIKNGIEDHFKTIDERVTSMDDDMKNRNNQLEDRLKEGLKDFERSQDRIKNRLNTLESSQEDMSKQLQKQIQEMKDVRFHLNSLSESSEKELDLQNKIVDQLSVQEQAQTEMRKEQQVLAEKLNKLTTDFSVQKKLHIAGLIAIIIAIGLEISSFFLK